MKIFGLTGGIACGKSAISDRVLIDGIKIVDADLIARDVVEPGGWGLSRVVSAFGDTVLNEDGTLDRKRLGNMIFSDDKMRWKLGKALGLPIATEIFRQLFVHWVTGEFCVVLDAPTLYETKSFLPFCNRVIVVSVSKDNQLKRLMKRDRMGKKDAQMRIDSQLPLEEKIKLADINIVNNGTLEQLHDKVDELVVILNQSSNTIWERFKSPTAILCVTYFNIMLFCSSLMSVWPLVFVTCCVGMYTVAFYMKWNLNSDLKLRLQKKLRKATSKNNKKKKQGEINNGNDADDESNNARD